MHKFEIVTDSSCNLTEDMIEKTGIHVLSLAYIVEGVEKFSYVRGQIFDYKAFYQQLKNKAKASTSQVTTAQAEELIRPLLEQGKNVLYIGFSSALSGTFSAVQVALNALREEFSNLKILEEDTLSASAGQALLVLGACKLRDEGASIEEAHKWVLEKKQKTNIYFTVDDLFHLQRGGRVSYGKAAIGSMLNVKPILVVNKEGKLVPEGKAKGRKKSLDYLIEKMAERYKPEEGADVYVIHGDSEEDAKYVKQQVEQRFKVNKVEFTFLEPVIGVHAGPGVIGLVFMGEEKSS